MIYLKVAHVDDEDADYFKFTTLQRAIDFIEVNSESEWVMSDIMFEEMPPNDYTLIGD